MILVFTGDGKGKTTSAIGQAIRVMGYGKKVLMVQFLKSEEWKTGEEKIIKKLINFKLIKTGKGFVDIKGDKFSRQAHKKSALQGLKIAEKEINSKKYSLIILDEINIALSLKLISLKRILDLIKIVPEDVDLILTGRYAPKEIIKKADLVTEFKEIKHLFQKNILAKKLREY